MDGPSWTAPVAQHLDAEVSGIAKQACMLGAHRAAMLEFSGNYATYGWLAQR